MDNLLVGLGRSRRFTSPADGAVVREALSAFRVVVTGPRQAGKTTLVLQVLDGHGTLQRLDDDGLLRAALADPASFAAFGEPPRAIDEVQRAGDTLVRAIKAIVDVDRTPGQFLLDGSADFLTVPTISESLAGRATFFELWPFSQGELDGGGDGLVGMLFDHPGRLRQGPSSPLALRDYLERVCIGGYAEVATLAPGARRRWFSSYVRTITQRDIADVTSLRRASALPRLLRLIAARTAGELVVANLHADAGLGSRDTTESYIGLLEMTYLVRRLPAWSRNVTTKMKRHAKAHITDSGLAAHLMGRDSAGLERPDEPARGQLMETFLVNELRRQIGWLDLDVESHHLRDRNGAEVDIVLESSDGRVCAIEVKAGRSVGPDDARWLVWLRDRLGDAFVHGLVLYAGERPLSFGDRITAVPISYLWLAD